MNERFTNTIQVLWSIELMYFPALGFIKLSFLFFYRRIFIKSASRHFRIISLSVILIVTIWILGFFFSYLFACKSHMSYYWTSTIKEEHYCVNAKKLHLGYSISDVLLDIIIIVIPIPLVCCKGPKSRSDSNI